MSKKIEYLRNPKTNRDIKIGGRLYQKYEKEGVIKDGKFVFEKLNMIPPKESKKKQPDNVLHKEPTKKELTKKEPTKKEPTKKELSETVEKKIEDVEDEQLRKQLLSSFKKIIDDMDMKYNEEELLKYFNKEYENL